MSADEYGLTPQEWEDLDLWYKHRQSSQDIALQLIQHHQALEHHIRELDKARSNREWDCVELILKDIQRDTQLALNILGRREKP